MTRALIIARQEFVKFVTRRGFLFTLIGVPLWIAAAVIVPPMFAKSEAPKAIVFTAIDRTGAYTDVLAQAVKQPDAKGRFMLAAPPAGLAATPADQFPMAAEKALTTGGLDAIVVVPRDFDAAHPAQIWSKEDSPGLHDFVQSHLTNALRLRGLRNLDPAEAAKLLDTQATVEMRKPAEPPEAG
ncbi:MAG TPA: hypothetical protein VG867_04805, partial [Rhizomicrobium sp.]|nr:hypothetical protein [Rhizomicrobium sp.]